VDLEGRRRSESLHHSDRRKAEKQRTKKEKQLRMGFCAPGSIRLKEFMEDSLRRTGDQIRSSTREEYQSAMNDFIKVVGNMDFQTVTLKHGEYYRQACLDRGNSPATVAKKLTEIKGFFQLAVTRRQLDENPFQYLKAPKCPENKIHVYKEHECERMMKEASDLVKEVNPKTRLQWDLMILFALVTGLRRGEILNCVWGDIDLGEQVVNVEPKKNTKTTWEWKIKDSERRTLPLTDELTHWLLYYQDKQPIGYPYVFVPPSRYDYIQNELRAKGKWKFSDSRLKVINNFRRDFEIIKNRARVKEGNFHDLRKTAICDWLAQGMSEYDVMKLAGHSDFRTTHEYYLVVKEDLILCQKLAHFGAPPVLSQQPIDSRSRKLFNNKHLKLKRP
jgi:integrase